MVSIQLQNQVTVTEVLQTETRTSHRSYMWQNPRAFGHKHCVCWRAHLFPCRTVSATTAQTHV